MRQLEPWRLEEWFVNWSPQKGVWRGRSWKNMTKPGYAEEVENLLGKWLLLIFGKARANPCLYHKPSLLPPSMS